MDSANIRNTERITGPDKDHKISLLLDYAGRAGQSIADPWYTGNFEITYKDIDDKIDYDVINKYIDIYQDFNSEDEWYNQVKILAEEMGYAPSVKMYKEDPTLYKGHIGDVCEMIRHLLTGRVKTPNLYQLLKIIGINEFKNRVEFYKN